MDEDETRLTFEYRDPSNYGRPFTFEAVDACDSVMVFLSAEEARHLGLCLLKLTAVEAPANETESVMQERTQLQIDVGISRHAVVLALKAFLDLPDVETWKDFLATKAALETLKREVDKFTTKYEAPNDPAHWSALERARTDVIDVAKDIVHLTWSELPHQFNVGKAKLADLANEIEKGRQAEMARPSRKAADYVAPETRQLNHAEFAETELANDALWAYATGSSTAWGLDRLAYALVRLYGGDWMQAVKCRLSENEWRAWEEGRAELEWLDTLRVFARKGLAPVPRSDDGPPLARK
jgi:hypothetical protein